MTACERSADNGGSKVRVYTQVYAPLEQKILTATVRDPSFQALAQVIRLAPVEDVEASAAKQGTAPPYRWSVPTLVVHNATDAACADSLAQLFQWTYGVKANVRPLPAKLKKQPGVVEFWVPPGGTMPATPAS